MQKNRGTEKNIVKKLLRIVRNILIGCGVLFILLLLIPTDEEEVEQDSTETVAVAGEETSFQETASKAESILEAVGAKKPSEVEDATTAVWQLIREKRQQQSSRPQQSAEEVTVLVYMNGSDLESNSGAATDDITEMLRASYHENVNVLLETIGTKSWSSRYGIASNRTQRYRVLEDEIELVDDSLGQEDCTDAESLAEFIRWGAEQYPAQRYILILWGHGAGPVYGFGYDEHQGEEEALTIDEMQTAVRQGGVYFDFIGMDCCIMSCMELCCALYDYCDYMILSEDFESGLGWEYTGWIDALSADPAIETQELGRIVIDDMVEANEKSRYGDSSTLALIDESYMKLLYTTWVDFAYANEEALLGANYSTKVERKGRYYDDYSMDDYYVTDIMAVAQNISAQETAALQSAVDQAVVYYRCTEDESGLTGISVTLPYGDSYFYDSLREIFLSCGINRDYVEWLGKFVDAAGNSEYYDYDDWYEEKWSGWDDYEDDYDWYDWDCELDDDWYDWDSYYYDWDDGDYDDDYDDWEYWYE